MATEKNEAKNALVTIEKKKTTSYNLLLNAFQVAILKVGFIQQYLPYSIEYHEIS